jgi:hypothetical protein
MNPYLTRPPPPDNEMTAGFSTVPPTPRNPGTRPSARWHQDVSRQPEHGRDNKTSAERAAGGVERDQHHPAQPHRMVGDILGIEVPGEPPVVIPPGHGEHHIRRYGPRRINVRHAPSIPQDPKMSSAWLTRPTRAGALTCLQCRHIAKPPRVGASSQPRRGWRL